MQPQFCIKGTSYCVLYSFEQADKGNEDANELWKGNEAQQLSNHVDTLA